MTVVQLHVSISTLENVDVDGRMQGPDRKVRYWEYKQIEGGISMRTEKILAFAVIAVGIIVAGPAGAVDLKSLVGTWKWTDFTVQAKECTANPSGAGLCMAVIAGPKNIGMEMIRSKFDDRAPNEFVGKIAHPASDEIYNTKMTINGDVWHMDGCTDAGVCATGDFIRQK